MRFFYGLAIENNYQYYLFLYLNLLHLFKQNLIFIHNLMCWSRV